MRISDWSSDVCSSDLHDSRTPLFTELAREFLRYLEARDEDPAMPWLRELAHYEWAELAPQISEATREDIAHDARGDPGSSPGQAPHAGCPLGSEERRVGTECGSKCESGCASYQ